MKLSAKNYAKLLLSLTEHDNISKENLSGFMTFLRKNRQERLLPRIVMAAEKLHKDEKGIKDVFVTVPEKIDFKQFEDSLKKALNAKHLNIHQSVEADMLGGARLQVDDRVYDFSVRRQLDLLKQHLTHGSPNQ